MQGFDVGWIFSGGKAKSLNEAENNTSIAIFTALYDFSNPAFLLSQSWEVTASQRFQSVCNVPSQKHTGDSKTAVTNPELVKKPLQRRLKANIPLLST